MPDNTATKPTVAIYCRVANEGPYSPRDIERQREVLERYALFLGYSHIAYYSDNGASGLTLDRPDFNSLCKEIESGRIYIVLMRDISRISRDFVAYRVWLEWAKKQGLEVVTMSEGKALPQFCSEKL